MRSTEESTDTFGKLGPKVEQQPAKPADTWKPTDNKYIQEKDGKLRTNLPEPTWPALFNPWKGIK